MGTYCKKHELYFEKGDCHLCKHDLSESIDTPGYIAKAGDRVEDENGNIGTVVRADDLHNIEVGFDGGGMGLYCMVKECSHYDPIIAI